jgi:hypothetical protein
MKRIDYRMPRTIAVFTMPSVVICALPHYLGVTTIKPEFEIFRTIFDGGVTGAFVGAVLYSIYAIIHNARLNNEETA